MAIGKGLAGGYIPLAATIVRRTVAETIVAAQGTILTGHTYSGHTAACAAGLAVQRIIERESLVARVKARGETLQRELRQALARFEEVGDVRGRGYLIGIELVQDRATKEPDVEMRDRVEIASFERGLILLGAGNNAIRWSPPLILAKENVDVALEIFDDAIAASLG